MARLTISHGTVVENHCVPKLHSGNCIVVGVMTLNIRIMTNLVDMKIQVQPFCRLLTASYICTQNISCAHAPCSVLMISTTHGYNFYLTLVFNDYHVMTNSYSDLDR